MQSNVGNVESERGREIYRVESLAGCPLVCPSFRDTLLKQLQIYVMQIQISMGKHREIGSATFRFASRRKI